MGFLLFLLYINSLTDVFDNSLTIVRYYHLFPKTKRGYVILNTSLSAVTVNVTLQMRRSWNIARRVDVGRHVWIYDRPRRRTYLLLCLFRNLTTWLILVFNRRVSHKPLQCFQN